MRDRSVGTCPSSAGRPQTRSALSSVLPSAPSSPTPLSRTLERNLIQALRPTTLDPVPGGLPMLIPHSRHHKGFASTKWNLHPARRPGAGLAVLSAFGNSDGTFCGVAHDIRELGDVCRSETLPQAAQQQRTELFALTGSNGILIIQRYSEVIDNNMQ